MKRRFSQCAAVLLIALPIPCFGDSNPNPSIEIEIVGEGPLHDLGAVQASLRNSGSRPIYLHPRAGVPFAYIDCFHGRWSDFGAPLPCANDCPSIDMSVLVVEPDETVSLLIPYQDATKSHKQQTELYEAQKDWKRKNDIEGGWSAKPPCGFPGTFRLRVMYSTGVWVGRVTLGELQRTISREFSVESGEPAN